MRRSEVPQRKIDHSFRLPAYQLSQTLADGSLVSKQLPSIPRRGEEGRINVHSQVREWV